MVCMSFDEIYLDKTTFDATTIAPYLVLDKSDLKHVIPKNQITCKVYMVATERGTENCAINKWSERDSDTCIYSRAKSWC